jgi:hypothetical protein
MIRLCHYQGHFGLRLIAEGYCDLPRENFGQVETLSTCDSQAVHCNYHYTKQARLLHKSDEDIPPEEWIYVKRDQAHLNNDKLNIPIRDDGQPYAISSLYKDQQEILFVVLNKIKEWINCRNIRNFKPLMMTINGPGGSGKSVLIQTIIAVLRTQFCTNKVALVAAPTGSAAFNVNGETLHRLVSIGISKNEEPLSDAKKKILLERFSDLLCLIIDERSLLSATTISKAETRIKTTIHNSLGDISEYFGGLPVVLLVGDDYQLPAQGGIIQLLARKKLEGVSARGVKIIQECGKKVMHLSTSRRMADSQQSQKTLLQKIRKGAVDLTDKDIKKLLSLRLDNIQKNHGPDTVQNIKKKSVFLYYTNKKKDTKNMEMLHEVSSPDNPVAIIKPKTTGPHAGKSIARHFSDSKPLQSTFLCIGSRVAINGVNHYPEWGLYNGACGIVQEIIFKDEKANPNNGDIPNYIVVEFPSYKGPSWDTLNPTHVPIPPVTHICAKKCCTRKVVPLILAWGITIHRFQGQSAGPVDKNKIPNPYECLICDPHDSSAENTHLGVFYTAISRATTLGDDNGLNSAFYLEGKEATEDRMKNIGQKQNSRDYHDTFVKRAKWVQSLSENTYKSPLTQEQQNDIKKWVTASRYTREDIQRILIQRQLE